MLIFISIFLLFFGMAHSVPSPLATVLASPNQTSDFALSAMKVQQYLNKVEPLEVMSLGRSASFGTLYDAREDRFIEGISMFTATEDDENFKAFITSTENKEAKLFYTLEHTLSDKFNVLDISAELKVSLMSDTIEVSGSGKFFKDEKKSEKISKAVLLHSISTAYEEITVTDEGIFDFVDTHALEAGTHVVVGIHWGGNLFLTLTDKNTENKDKQEIEGALSVTMKKASLEISGNATVNITNEELEKRRSYEFVMDGDIRPDSNPQSLDEVIEFMKRSPELLSASNNGRGKQVKYMLVPIAALKLLWNKREGQDAILGSIEQDAVQMAVNVFDQVNLCDQKLNDLNDDKEAYVNYLPNDIINHFEEIYHNFTLYKISLKSRFADAVKKARYGEIVNIKGLMEEFKAHGASHKAILFNFYKWFGPLLQELSFIKVLQKIQVTILHKENYLPDFVLRNEAHDVYVLIYNFDYPNEQNEAINTFRVISENRKDPKYENAVFGVLNYKLLTLKLPYRDITEKPAVYLFQHQTLSNKHVQVDVKGLNNSNSWGVDEMKKILQNRLKEQHIAPGFMYVQYPYTQKPSDLWPNSKWEDYSKYYEDAMFRAFTKDSAPFTNSYNNVPFTKAKIPEIEVNVYPSKKYYGGAPIIEDVKRRQSNKLFGDCKGRPCPLHEVSPHTPMAVGRLPIGAQYDARTKLRLIISDADQAVPVNHAIKIWRVNV